MLGSFEFSRTEEDCLALLKECCKNTLVYTLPEKGKMVELTYTINNITAVSDNKTQSVTVTVKASREKLHMKTLGYELYRDTLDAFTIMTQQKQIYWTTPVSVKQLLEQDVTSGLINTIIESSTVAYCKPIAHEHYSKEMKLLPSAEVKKRWSVEYMLFRIKDKDKKLYSSTIVYEKGQAVEMTEIIYERMDFGPEKDVFSGSAKNKIVTGSNVLLSSYKGYTLLDQRNKK